MPSESGTLCRCSHFRDIHDISGVCSFPDCQCHDFAVMPMGKKVDGKLAGLFGRFGKKKGREQVENM